MLRNVIINVLSRNKNALFKRYNVPQTILNIRYNQNKSNQYKAGEIDDDDEDCGPIKYSESKAAKMRINEYRISYDEPPPSYEIPLVMISVIVFLIYFCILREENDIDALLYVDLGTSLKRIGEDYERQNRNKKVSK